MKRKTGLYLTMCLIVAAGFIAGCKVPTDPNSPCLTCEKTTTLQGKVMDAMTHQAIGGADLKMYLIQGTNTRTPDVLYTGIKPAAETKQWWEFWKPTPVVDNSTAYQDLIGEYAFKNIPSAASAPEGESDARWDYSNDLYGNNYKLVVIKDGYQRWESVLDEYFMANEDNVIGDVYLYPTNYPMPCYTVTVLTWAELPLSGATVHFSPFVEQNRAWVSDYPENALWPEAGYLASITKKTGADGTATFCAADGLAAGAAYIICVDSVKESGVDYTAECLDGFNGNAPTADKPKKFPGIIAGLTNDLDDLTFWLSPSEKSNDYGLYVTKQSNQVNEQIDYTGTLVLTFNRPIGLKLTNDSSNVAKLFATIDNATGPDSSVVWNFPVSPSTVVPTRVNWALSSDNLTLTLTPNWVTAPLATRNELEISYFDGFTGTVPADATATPALLPYGQAQHIVVKGYPESDLTLFGILGSSGVTGGCDIENYQGECMGENHNNIVNLTAP